MRSSTTSCELYAWTSGAVALRRRRRRRITTTLAIALLAASLALTTAAAHGLVRLPNGLPDPGPASVEAGAGAEQVGPILPERDEQDDEVVVRGDDPAEVADGVVEPELPTEAVPTEDEPNPGETTHDEEAPRADAVDIAAVQTRLRALGYLIGPADGTEGQQTLAAVMAFQRVNDLQVDGVVGPQTLAALDAPVRVPELRGGPATRIEVDLDRQILHLVEGGERVVTLKVSTGNGQPYRTASGGTAYARTPIGEFVIERRIHGVRNAALGTLYDPLYFHRGFAIHGSPSVPAGPASHGCVRVSRADAAWLIQRVPDGTPVHLYGGTHVFAPAP